MRTPPLRPLLWVLWLPVACARSGPTVPRTSLAGDGVVVLVEPGGGCGGGATVRAWGPAWGTDGASPAEVEADASGGLWLWFPLRSGLGEGQAALHLLGEVAMMPLGARPGEHELKLKPAPWPSDAQLSALDEALGPRLEAEAEAWAVGRFTLMDKDAVVGEIQIEGERAEVSVFDRGWLTPEPAPASLVTDGPDLVLSFPVEPSFQGDGAVLRVNVPTREVVVPADAAPTELDRTLRVEPGALSAEARAAAVAAAMAAADADELEATGRLATRLAVEARDADGDCRSLDRLDLSWALLLPGYSVTIVASGPVCEVRITPVIPQHGRRLKGRFGPDGRL